MRIWDVDQGIVVTEITGVEPEDDLYDHFGPTLAIDPSGRSIASTVNRGVRVFDVESGALVATMPAQPGEIITLAFSPDGASVATGANDGTVRLFDVGSGTQALVLHGPPDYVRSLSFSSDGSLLASVDGTTIRVWTLDIDDLFEIARREFTRSLTDQECRQYLHMGIVPTCSNGVSRSARGPGSRRDE